MSPVSDDRNSASADLELLDRLGGALDMAEQVPAPAMAMAYAACQMARVEAELAELVFDSLTGPQATLRRGNEHQARLLSFSNDHLTLDIALSADGRTIVGEIHPALASELAVERRDLEVATTPIDAFGRFRLESDAASFRLRVVGHLVTPWIDRR